MVVEPLWTPSQSRVEASNLRAFEQLVAGRHGVDVRDFVSLHRWSVDQPDRFWSAVWDWTEVRGDKGDRLIESPADDELFWRTRFLPDATLNFAENLLRRDDDTLAMIFRGEDGGRRDLTWRQLNELVSRLQQRLIDVGVQPGDRVAAWLPNVPEIYAVMLAASSIGATFSSTSPDFGVDGVVDRFGQIEPVVLFAADGYRYGAKEVDCLGRMAQVLPRLPSVREVVVVPFLSPEPDLATAGSVGAVVLDEWLGDKSPDAVTFRALPFDHPLYILYSSGTTGAPKCIVHRAGGILLKHLVEHRLHCDVKPGDRVFYFTTAGWMMWNWLASGLASEATLVLYDGNPAHPDAHVLFDLADECAINLFGTSAKFIDATRKAGIRPLETHDLSSVRTITSTGSPLVREGFEFVYAHISPTAHLASISGGTDLCGCLVAGDPTSPVWPGEIQRPGLGMAIDVVSEDGGSLPPGERGELVCRSAFPSMPLGFWNDPGDERYRAAYFERIPGVWHQGDYAERTEHDGFVIQGRSDATLNPGGVRIGTAEIYRRVDALDEVIESLVVGQEWDGDVRVVLFVHLREGATLDDDLQLRIRDTVRRGASPRHVPARILQVGDIPRTRSGKLVELAVREVIHGRPVKNIEALANAKALDEFRDRPELLI